MFPVVWNPQFPSQKITGCQTGPLDWAVELQGMKSPYQPSELGMAAASCTILAALRLNSSLLCTSFLCKSREGHAKK